MDIDMAITDLTGRGEVLRAELAGLERNRFTDPRASEQIDSVEEMPGQRRTAARKGRIGPREAPACGTAGGYRAASAFGRRPSRRRQQTEYMVRLAISKRESGRPASHGHEVLSNRRPQTLEARLVIDQGDVEFVAPGQRVKIMLTQSAEHAYVSKIERVSDGGLEGRPTHLSSLHGGPLATQMSANGSAAATQPCLRSGRAFAEGRPSRSVAAWPGGPGKNHHRSANAHRPAVPVLSRGLSISNCKANRLHWFAASSARRPGNHTFCATALPAQGLPALGPYGRST